LSKYITSQFSKLSACRSSIQKAKNVYNSSTVDFYGTFELVFASLRHKCTHTSVLSKTDKYLKVFKCSHTMLMLDIKNLRTKYNLHVT